MTESNSSAFHHNGTFDRESQNKRGKWSVKGKEVMQAIALLRQTPFSNMVPKWYKLLDFVLALGIVLTMVYVYYKIASTLLFLVVFR